MNNCAGWDLVAFLEEHAHILELLKTPKVERVPQPRGTAQKGRGMSDDEFRIHCARNYLRKTPGAVAGDRGHNATFGVAIHLTWGFGLDPETAKSLLREWSQTCDPPWDEYQINHKIEDSLTKTEDKPQGWRFEDACRKAGRKVKPPVVAPVAAPPPLGDGAPPPEAAPAEPLVEYERAQILLTYEEDVVADAVIEALTNDDNLYQREGGLYHVVRAPGKVENGIVRQVGTPHLTPIHRDRLRLIMSKHIEFIKERRNPKTDEFEEVSARPPEWLVGGVYNYGEYRGIRVVDAIVESPVIRPDGTILQTPGYDAETRILYEPNADFLPVKENPTYEDASEAVWDLFDLVENFPFASELHKACWLAGLLTPFARPAIDGPCPLFLIDANSAGTGKSLLCDVISLIVTGRDMPRTTYPDNEEEMRKRITSIALGADVIMLLDNINGPLGGSNLDSALTSATWKDRILGRSGMTASLPLRFVWYATGNNVSFRGDISRRVIPSCLITDEEKPKSRTNFTHPRIKKYVFENRTKYVRDCLTILRAYCAAGMPKKDGIGALGSYEEWCDVVQQAVYWITGEDVTKSQDEYAEDDPRETAHASFVLGWKELCEGGPDTMDGVTAAHALEILKASACEPHRYTLLKEVLARSAESGDFPGPHKLSYKLRDIKNKVFSGYRLVQVKQFGVPSPMWKVIEVGSDEGRGG